MATVGYPYKTCEDFLEPSAKVKKKVPYDKDKMSITMADGAVIRFGSAEVHAVTFTPIFISKGEK
jgi:hypothetical protein